MIVIYYIRPVCLKILIYVWALHFYHNDSLASLSYGVNKANWSVDRTSIQKVFCN